MVGHVPHAIPLEVVGTMIEMADVAWNALEHRREWKADATDHEDAAILRAENLRLREILADNLSFLQALSDDCPPDLHKRLEAVVDGSCFQTKLKALQQEFDNIPHGYIPLGKTEGEDIDDKDIVVYAKDVECMEVASGIDNENYVVVSEDNVINGIANFIAGCIIENPKSKVLSPEELQRTHWWATFGSTTPYLQAMAIRILNLTCSSSGCERNWSTFEGEAAAIKKMDPAPSQEPEFHIAGIVGCCTAVMRALCGFKDRSKLKKVWEVGKVIYTLSTWGLVFAGLYRHQAAVKVAARGIHSTSKIILKAL